MAFGSLHNSNRFSKTTPNKYIGKVKTMCFLCNCRLNMSPQEPLRCDQIIITIQTILSRNPAVASAKSSDFSLRASLCPCGKEK